MALEAGAKVGPYEILTLIGAGGMGEVYRATDARLGRDVALKILSAALAGDADYMARFQREAKILASLNHPHIAIVHGLEESGGVRALVMELVEGPTLADRIAQGPMAHEEAVSIAVQIAEALEAAHEKGIIHRDLKPANVKVTPQGTVKVLDFGLAKAADDGAPTTTPNSPTLTMRATQMGVIMGTAAYMSPEQASGKPVDRRTDVWSFGAVLWEMLTGRPLFGGETISHTLADVLRAPIEFEKLPKQTPAAIRELLRRCLDRDIKNRLQAIGEARIALQKPSQVDAPAPPGRSVSLWRASSGILVIALAAVSWTAWRATRPIERPMVRLSVDLGPDAVGGNRVTAIISPDGTRLAFPMRAQDGKQLLGTRLLDQERAVLLPGTEEAADPFFSPDGQWIGFFAAGKMKKVSVLGGAVVTLCDAPDGRGAAWGEDGYIVAALNSTAGTGLSRIAAAGGVPERFTRPAQGEIPHRWPQILPDGKGVLFTGGQGVVGGLGFGSMNDATIEVFTPKDGRIKLLHRGGYFGRYLPTGHLVYINQETLFGLPFDLDRLEARGAPVPLLEDVGSDTSAGGGQLDFSRSGTLVYLSGRTSERVTVSLLDADGQMQALVPAPGRYLDLRLSPDGKRLAFSSAGNLQVYDAARDAMTRLTFTSNARNPVWTPDGKHIAFTSNGSVILWIRSDGAGEAHTLLESKNLVQPYSFSPDGKHLAFDERAAETGRDLWTLPLDVSDSERPKAGKPEQFLRTSFSEQDPAFSPDGRWIAYTSNEAGRNEVYVRPFPGGGSAGSGKWLVSFAGGRFPVWSRAGRELFYETLDGHIMAAGYLATGDSFSAEKPRERSHAVLNLGIGWNFDASPDNKRFVVLTRQYSANEQRSSLHVTFLLNFFDEVRRRIPPGGR